MQMASRVQRSLRDLAARLSGAEMRQTAVVATLRAWVDDSLRRVSAKADAAIGAGTWIQRLLTADPMELPISREAFEHLVSMAQTSLTRDPVRLVEEVNRACERLVAYRLPLGTCRTCQGDLALWAAPTGELALVCELLGCAWSLDERVALRADRDWAAAARSRVLAAFPDADLLPR